MIHCKRLLQGSSKPGLYATYKIYILKMIFNHCFGRMKCVISTALPAQEGIGALGCLVVN